MKVSNPNPRRQRRFGAALAILFIAASGGAAASGVEPVHVGETSEGQVLIDKASLHDHHSHGFQRATVSIRLAKPIGEAGQFLTDVEETQDWDCEARLHRVVQRIFRNSDGLFVRVERPPRAWSPVVTDGAAGKAFKLACPRGSEADEAATAQQAEPPTSSSAKLPSKPAVIRLPQAQTR